MVNRESDLLARDLVRLLIDMTGLHGEWAMLMQRKRDAIKQADSDLINSLTARETTLAERVAEREGLRRQITNRLLDSLGREPIDASGAQVSLTQLAECFPEPRRSQLLVAASGLRDKVQEVDRLHKTLSMITREMLVHMNEVIRVMCAGVRSDIYSRSGRQQKGGAAAVFEAVG